MPLPLSQVTDVFVSKRKSICVNNEGGSEYLLSSWCVLGIVLTKKKKICVNFLIQSLGQPNGITVTTHKNEAKRSDFPGFKFWSDCSAHDLSFHSDRNQQTRSITIPSALFLTVTCVGHQLVQGPFKSSFQPKKHDGYRRGQFRQTDETSIACDILR